MKKYIARTSVEYSIEVEAESEEAALLLAEHTEFSAWYDYSTPIEIEEVEDATHAKP